jgi:hypothetical protein
MTVTIETAGGQRTLSCQHTNLLARESDGMRKRHTGYMRHETPDGRGEVSLIMAILRQAILDMGSKVGKIQEDAQQFFRNKQAVAFWADLVDMDPARLLAAVEQRGRHAP